MEYRFEITITGMENHTWHGRLHCAGEDVRFHSELELLRALGRLLPETQPAPAWEAAQPAQDRQAAERGPDRCRPI